MAGKRIRCVCGTVFDPTAQPNCPACGTPYIEAVAPTAQQPASPAERQATPARLTQRDSATGLNAVQQDWLQRNKTPVSVAAGVVGLILFALILRDRDGGKSAKSDSGEVNRGAVAQDTENDIPGDQAPQDVSPAPSNVLPITPQRPPPAPVQHSDVPAFKGKWTLLTARMQPEAVIPGLPVTRSVLAHTVMTAFAGTGATSTLTITDAGSYQLDVDITGDGFYTANTKPTKHLLSMAADGVLSFTPNGVDLSDRARATLRPVKFDMPQLDVKANDTELSLLPQGATGGAPSVWFRPGDSGREHGDILGTWSYPQVFVDSYLPYRGTLELQDGGNYRIRFTRTEQGMLSASGGEYEFKRSIAMGPPVQGRYAFDGPNRFTLTEPRGTATWVRADGDARPPAGSRPPPRGVRK